MISLAKVLSILMRCSKIQLLVLLIFLYSLSISCFSGLCSYLHSFIYSIYFELICFGWGLIGKEQTDGKFLYILVEVWVHENMHLSKLIKLYVHLRVMYCTLYFCLQIIPPETVNKYKRSPVNLCFTVII